MSRIIIRLTMTTALAALALAAGPARGAAFCSSTPTVTYVHFPIGSAQLPDRVASEHVAKLAPLISSSSRLVSYSILAMGDLAEGAEWDNASAEARTADRALASARAAALRLMLRRLPKRYRTRFVGAHARPSRQLFTVEQQLAEPGLHNGVRAVVRTWFRYVLPGGIIPTC